MQYDHIGIPTTDEKNWSSFVEAAKVHITDPGSDPYGVEWLKFESGSPMPELIQKVSHVAFEVENLEAAIRGAKIIVEPFEAMPGVHCAFIDHDGAPVELIQKTKKQGCGCSCCG
ncbi:MAG: VOC family protein [Thermoguttaceae bacterium]